MPIPAFEGIGVPQPSSESGKRCFNLGPVVIPVQCDLIRALPESYRVTVCKARAIGNAVLRTACVAALEGLKFPVAGAMLLCNKVIGQDACCPGGLPPPPLDPPVPTDYEAGGMRPPSSYGIPSPLVGGCGCVHEDFGEEDFDGNVITGNVSGYRP